jgi:hypothetical protein
VFQVEETHGLALMRALTAAQREKATVSRICPARSSRRRSVTISRCNTLVFAMTRCRATTAPTAEVIQTYVGNIGPDMPRSEWRR